MVSNTVCRSRSLAARARWARLPAVMSVTTATNPSPTRSAAMCSQRVPSGRRSAWSRSSGWFCATTAKNAGARSGACISSRLCTRRAPSHLPSGGGSSRSPLALASTQRKSASPPAASRTASNTRIASGEACRIAVNTASPGRFMGKPVESSERAGEEWESTGGAAGEANRPQCAMHLRRPPSMGRAYALSGSIAKHDEWRGMPGRQRQSLRPDVSKSLRAGLVADWRAAARSGAPWALSA